MQHNLRALIGALCALAVPCANTQANDREVPAAAAERPARHVEVPGVKRFSGQLIVRPRQHDAWIKRGATPKEATQWSAVACMVLATYPLRNYVPETDEYVIQCPPGFDENAVANDLLTMGCYQYAEPDWIIYPSACPDDPLLSNQWHHDAGMLQTCDAWGIHTGDPSVSVGICDTGILTTHDDLQLHRLEGYNAVDMLFESEGGQIGPVHSHGTQTTGCAAANGNNGVGVSGVGWNLSHRMLRVSNSSTGGSTLSVLQHAARTSIESGDRVASVSYSGVENASNLTTATYIKSIGGLLVWAAGNDGRNLILGDRDADDIIVVGATDSLDNKAMFSAYGPFVDVMAPGVGVFTTHSSGNGSYTAVSGTSFSAPLTAGLIALIWSSDPSLSPDQVETRLKAGCDDLGLPGVDNTFAYGRINVYNSLATAVPVPPVVDAGTDLVTSDSDGDALEAVILDGTGSFDPDGTIVAYQWSEGATLLGMSAVVSVELGLGVHSVTLTATDNDGQSSSDTVIVTINPNQPPVADAGADITVSDVDGDGLELVVLDGSASFDPDGTIVSLEWAEGAVGLGSGSLLSVNLAVGDHTMTLTVTDNGGASVSDTVLVSVVGQSPEPPAPPPPPGPVSLASDDFESGGFNGGFGRWVGAWAASGKVSVRTKGAPHAGAFHARLTKANTDLRRAVDLRGASEVHLTFWAKAKKFRGSDRAFVRVSPDGSSFTTLLTFTAADSDNAYHRYDLDLGNFPMTASFVVDFATATKKGKLFVDDVDITGLAGPPSNLDPVADAGPDLLVGDTDGDGVEIVTLDGLGSIDFDGSIVGFEWTEGATVLGTTAVLDAAFGVGSHTVTLTVTDNELATASDTVLVTVLPQGNDPVTLAFDGFESQGLSGGAGDWVGSWSKTGRVTIRTNRDSPHSGSSHVRLRRVGSTLGRTVDLTGVMGARLQLWIKTASFRAGDQASVRVAPDGVNFVTVLTINPGDDDNLYHFHDIDLSSFAMTADFRVELRSDMKRGKLWADDIEVVGVSGG